MKTHHVTIWIEKGRIINIKEDLSKKMDLICNVIIDGEQIKTKNEI
jgi:hypothetical protein